MIKQLLLSSLVLGSPQPYNLINSYAKLTKNRQDTKYYSDSIYYEDSYALNGYYDTNEMNNVGPISTRAKYMQHYAVSRENYDEDPNEIDIALQSLFYIEYNPNEYIFNGQQIIQSYAQLDPQNWNRVTYGEVIIDDVNAWKNELRSKIYVNNTSYENISSQITNIYSFINTNNYWDTFQDIARYNKETEFSSKLLNINTSSQNNYIRTYETGDTIWYGKLIYISIQKYWNGTPYTQQEIDNYGTNFNSLFKTISYDITYQVPDDNINYEVIDIPGLMFSILGMPFAWLSTAFNLTIFPGTPYAVNISHIFMAIIGVAIIIFILKKVLR